LESLAIIKKLCDIFVVFSALYHVHHIKVKVKVKQSRFRPRVAQRVPGS
jgi:hypothetical protein